MSLSPLVSGVDAVLRPLGFQRRKGTWNRKAEQFVDVIDLQLAKSKDRATVNVGVLEVGVYRECWGDVPEFIQEASCIVRTRPVKRDVETERWWLVDDISAASEVRAEVESFGLEFLNRMHSLAEMRDFLIKKGVKSRLFPPEGLYLAVLEARLGNVAAACELLATMRNKLPDAWQPRIAALTVSFDCQVAT